MNTQKNNGTTLLIAAICFIAIGVLMVGSIYFDNNDIREAKVWLRSN
jgi:hypothetical protein